MINESKMIGADLSELHDLACRSLHKAFEVVHEVVELEDRLRSLEFMAFSSHCKHLVGEDVCGWGHGKDDNTLDHLCARHSCNHPVWLKFLRKRNEEQV